MAPRRERVPGAGHPHPQPVPGRRPHRVGDLGGVPRGQITRAGWATWSPAQFRHPAVRSRPWPHRRAPDALPGAAAVRDGDRRALDKILCQCFGRAVLDVEVIEDPAAAVVALDPVRARLLAELGEPASAAALAGRVGLTRQKVNYHLRALEAHGLVARRRASAGGAG